MMLNINAYQSTKNFKMPLSVEGQVIPSKIDELKQFVHQKDLLEHLVLYAFKIYRDLPFAIVRHDGIVIFVYKCNNDSAIQFLNNADIPFIN